MNIPFRIIFGFLADRKFLRAITMNTICLFISTLCLLVNIVSYIFFSIEIQNFHKKLQNFKSYFELKNFWFQAVFAVFYGLSIAGMNCLSTPYLIEAVGSSKFGNANGILNLFRGVGCFFGPYLAGKSIFSSKDFIL